MTCPPLTEPLPRSIASLIERIASAKRENGESITAQNMFASRETILSEVPLTRSRRNYRAVRDTRGCRLTFIAGTSAMQDICNALST